MKIPVVEGACTVRQHCPSCRTKLHHRLVFAILNASMLGCLRSFFSLQGKRHCCEKKRGFPEERSFIGQDRAVSGFCAAHGQEG